MNRKVKRTAFNLNRNFCTFDPFNASLLNESIDFLKIKKIKSC